MVSVKITERIINILKAKINAYCDWKQFGGCFTYAEVVILVDHYGVHEREYGWTYRWSKDHLAKGENGSTWFYFTPSTKFNKQFKEISITERHHQR